MIHKPPIPRMDGSFPPTARECKAGMRNALLDLQADILTACYDYSARTGNTLSNLRLISREGSYRKDGRDVPQPRYLLGISIKL
jgi:hypothetical protein